MEPTSNLPDLPRQLKRKEADFGVEFRHWWEANPFKGNFELKHTKGKDSLPFSAVEQEQVIVGNAARGTKGILLRLVKGTIGSPDYIGQIEQPVFIAIRYPHFFCIIPIADFLKEKANSERKSLTSDRAQTLSTVVVPV